MAWACTAASNDIGILFLPARAAQRSRSPRCPAKLGWDDQPRRDISVSHEHRLAATQVEHGLHRTDPTSQRNSTVSCEARHHLVEVAQRLARLRGYSARRRL